MAPSAEQARHAENVFHIALRQARAKSARSTELRGHVRKQSEASMKKTTGLYHGVISTVNRDQ